MPAATRSEAAASLPDRIAFLGLGLIGGSIALALREAGYRGTLASWTPRGNGPAEARRRGIVDEAPGTPDEAVAAAGLVILAGPPLAILQLLGDRGGWRAALGGEATVSDVGSTKALIVEAANVAGLPFVGAHPMAGRESSGLMAATNDLFVDKPWVMVPGAAARAQDLARAEGLATATGARTVRMSAADHDAAVAAISHLPLVVAAALVESVAGPGATASWPAARDLAASGWRDMTRLAKGDPEMGAGILATNAAPVADRVRHMRNALDLWIAQLEEGVDADALRVRLAAARSIIDVKTPR